MELKTIKVSSFEELKNRIKDNPEVWLMENRGDKSNYYIDIKDFWDKTKENYPEDYKMLEELYNSVKYDENGDRILTFEEMKKASYHMDKDKISEWKKKGFTDEQIDQMIEMEIALTSHVLFTMALNQLKSVVYELVKK
ncbi:MAG: hypothetical protein N2169_05975 [bacterium]|nr:hypothetical protein [bacterium]